MAWINRIVTALVVVATLVASASGEVPPAMPGIKIEFRWAEFKPVAGLTEDKGVPFGEEGTSLTFFHKQAALTNADIAEARVEKGFLWEINGQKIELHCVKLYLTKEGQQKLAKSGKPGTKQLLALLVDGRNTSTFYVDVADLTNFAQGVGYYELKDAEGLAAQINATIKAARGNDPADKAVVIFDGHTSAVTALMFTADGRRIVSASSNDMRTWDAGTGKNISVVSGLGGPAVAFSADGQQMAIASRDNVSLHDVADAKKLLSIEPHGDWDRSFPFRPAIGSVAISPNGELLATGGSTTKVGGPHGMPAGVVTIWDAKTGKQLHRFVLSTFAITLTFSRDGKFLAAGTIGAGGELPEPGEVWVWDTASGKPVHTFKTKERVTWEDTSSFTARTVAFSPDGKQLAAAVTGARPALPAGLIPQGRQPADSVVWNLESGRVEHSLKFEKRWAGTIAFSPDGKWLATAGGGDLVARVWSTATGKQHKFFSFGSHQANAIAFSPDSNRLAVGGSDDGQSGIIKVWPLASEADQTTKNVISSANATEVRPVAAVAKQVHKILLGPGPGELTFYDFGNLEIVDDVNFRPLRKLAEQSKPNDFALSHDGRFAAWQAGASQTYVLQELANGKTVEIKFEKSPGFAAFSRDSKVLAIGETTWSANAEGEGHSEMKLFDLSGKLVRTLESPGPGVMTPVFSPDGKTLAVGNRNYETRLFDVATGKLLHTLPRRMTHEVKFSPDGKSLAAGYVDGAVVLWNVSDGTMRHSMTNVAKEIYTLDWSPTGDLLVTAGRDGKIVLWDSNKMIALEELDAPKWVCGVRFTADGTRLLSTGGMDYGRAERKVVIWAVENSANQSVDPQRK